MEISLIGMEALHRAGGDDSAVQAPNARVAPPAGSRMTALVTFAATVLANVLGAASTGRAAAVADFLAAALARVQFVVNHQVAAAITVHATPAIQGHVAATGVVRAEQGADD